jgi:hypothetical protein
MDVRKLFDKEYLYAYDLDGRDVTVEIESVKGGTLVGQGGRSNKKPVLKFRGKDKALAINITMARTIAGLYGGFDAALWIGKRITLYPTTTTFGSQTVECIRIRNVVPQPTRRGSAATDQPTETPAIAVGAEDATLPEGF